MARPVKASLNGAKRPESAKPPFTTADDTLAPPTPDSEPVTLDKSLALRLIISKLEASKTCDWFGLAEKLNGDGVRGAGEKVAKGRGKKEREKEGGEKGLSWTGTALYDLYHNTILPALKSGRAVWNEDDIYLGAALPVTSEVVCQGKTPSTHKPVVDPADDGESERGSGEVEVDGSPTSRGSGPTVNDSDRPTAARVSAAKPEPCSAATRTTVIPSNAATKLVSATAKLGIPPKSPPLKLAFTTKSSLAATKESAKTYRRQIMSRTPASKATSTGSSGRATSQSKRTGGSQSGEDDELESSDVESEFRIETASYKKMPGSTGRSGKSQWGGGKESASKRKVAGDSEDGRTPESDLESEIRISTGNTKRPRRSAVKTPDYRDGDSD